METDHIPTGHRDCCGEMIRQGDDIVTRHGQGTVEWDGNAWKIHYQDGHLEPLNCYDKSRLRRVAGMLAARCDNKENQVLSQP
jgi:hypothetical protein